MRGFTQISSVAVVFSLALGCATVPAKPPTEEALQDKVAAHGAQSTYDHYKVDLDGNAFCGQEVHVGGSDKDKDKAPARYYFTNAPFEVEHLNTWASYVGSGLSLCGSLSATTSSILFAMNQIQTGAYVGCLCAVPLYLSSIPFFLYANWDMEEATADYNSKLKKKIFAVQANTSSRPADDSSTAADSIPRTSKPETDPATQTTEQPAADPKPEQSGSAPFTY